MHRDKKKLALAIVLAISSYPSFDHAMAQAITTQGDIDSQINAPLQSGNQTITTSTIDTIRNPWTPSVPSQRCLYLIQSNDSRDFEHPRVHFNRCCTDWLSS